MSNDRQILKAPLPVMSRAECREMVLARDRWCRAAGLIPVPCETIPTDVHELGRGQYRRDCCRRPELCLGLCSACHLWVTHHPVLAHDVGLVWWGWEVQQWLNKQETTT